MFVEFLSLTDFRTYPQLDIALKPGVTVFVGSNGVGKTNIVEAIGYLASLSSHRVSNDAPLIRFDSPRSLVRARVDRGGRSISLELEITAGKANRARINRGAPVRARDILGHLRTVLFAPEDLALVKGDPSNRRRFLDELLASLVPHHAATRSDFERVLKQRNALLKSARASGRFTSAHESTLEVWDQHMAEAGAALLKARLELVDLLQPHLNAAYAALTDGSKQAAAVYRSTIHSQLSDDGEVENDGGAGLPPLASLSAAELAELYLAAFKQQRKREVERGISLVGPHRDELELMLGQAPAKGYASPRRNLVPGAGPAAGLLLRVLRRRSCPRCGSGTDPGRCFCRTGQPAPVKAGGHRCQRGAGDRYCRRGRRHPRSTERRTVQGGSGGRGQWPGNRLSAGRTRRNRRTRWDNPACRMLRGIRSLPNRRQRSPGAPARRKTWMRRKRSSTGFAWQPPPAATCAPGPTAAVVNPGVTGRLPRRRISAATRKDWDAFSTGSSQNAAGTPPWPSGQ